MAATKKAEAPASKTPKKISVVKYIGTSDVRSISRADWATIDIDHDDRGWSKTNRFQIDADNFSDEALAYLAEDDEDFVIVDLAVDLAAVAKPNPHPDITY